MNARKEALSALIDITEKGAYANLRLKQSASALEERDARFVSALVYTTLDHLLYIDHVLSYYVKAAPKSSVRCVLRLGVCELLYMDTPAHAAVSQAVDLTKSIGKGALSGFVNGVLRSIERDRTHLPKLPDDPVMRLSIQYSYPAWLVAEWTAQYGAAFTEQLLSAPAAPTEVRAQYPFSTEALEAALPVPVTRERWDENCLALTAGVDLSALPAFIDGSMTVQSQSAMLVCRALGDCRKKRVLDLCAAPGGKSAYLASLAENDVSLTCFELHAHRKALLDKTLTRLHVSAATEQRDGTRHDPALDGRFDAVLLDAPCSGLGLLNDKPDIRYAKSDADIDALAALQAALLTACAPYPAPGGLLVYATCTISKRENEAQIEAFLGAHPDYALEPMPLSIENNGMLQLFPHVHGTDGFFLARLRRCPI